jgi:hypothetical protein
MLLVIVDTLCKGSELIAVHDTVRLRPHGFHHDQLKDGTVREVTDVMVVEKITLCLTELGSNEDSLAVDPCVGPCAYDVELVNHAPGRHNSHDQLKDGTVREVTDVMVVEKITLCLTECIDDDEERL